MLDYKGWMAEVRSLAGVTPNDEFFTSILPGGVDYAEQRIYRELDLLSTVTEDSSQQFTPLNRSLNLPTNNHWVTVQQVNVITPAGSPPETGTRNSLLPVSRQFLNIVYGSPLSAGLPIYFAMQTDQQIIVGPWPDDDYTVEFVGTIRPAPLSPTNTETFLSKYLPDLFVAASMVFFAGYQKNYGAQADDPKMAQSWENQYQTLFQSANAEELRKKFSAPSPQPVRSE